ncbi:glycosyltransferase [Streptomyces sp. NPDC002763]|uniref:glycosyltransferase n=1 Tax=Streptomyces sp. NPDC002763 TaxID=3154427 RepID=UPI00333240F6
MAELTSGGPQHGRDGPRIAVFSMDAVGHLNPMLALVSALTGDPRHCRVRAYGSPALGALYRRAGAEFVPLDQRTPAPDSPPLSEPRPSDLAVRSFLAPQNGLDAVVNGVARFAPDVVVHDVFDLRGAVAARALGVPAAAVLPFAGLRALGDGFVRQHGSDHPALRAANARLVRDFGTDVLGDPVCLPVLFPSRSLSLVTAVEAQSPPPGAAGMEALRFMERALGPALRWTGPWLGDVYWGEESAHAVAYERAARRRAQGALSVLFSLGTNISTFRREAPMGGARSGAEYFDVALDLLLAALGDDHRFHLLIARGSSEVRRAWPANAVVADVLPQRALLAGAVDVFITHHGYNSTVEAVLHGVPAVALPGYGDQVANAAFSVARGVSVAHWDLRGPATSCTPDLLRRAVLDAASATGPAEALPGVRRELLAGGGVGKAAELVTELAAASCGVPRPRPGQAP